MTKKKEKKVATGLETTLGQRNVAVKWSPTNVWGSTCMHKEKPRAQYHCSFYVADI